MFDIEEEGALPPEHGHQLNTPEEIAQIRKAHAQGRVVEWWCVDEWQKEKVGPISDWAFSNYKFRTKPEQDENGPHADIQYRSAKERFDDPIKEHNYAPSPILWWEKQAAEQCAIKEDIINLRNSIRFWHGIEERYV